MASTSLTGLAANDPVPGEYAEINFAQGAASSGSNTYSVLFLGNKSSAGSATVDSVIYGPATPVSLSSEADAIALFGTGSELHRMIRRFLAVNKSTPFYAVAVTASAGSAATGTLTIATTATGSATLRIYVQDEFVDVGIVSGDTVTTIAAAAVLAINGKTHWAVTASNIAGVITLTAKVAGLRGNFIRYFGQIKPAAGSTVSVTASTLMTGGTTADDSTAALAAILAQRYYYIVSAAEDATQIGALLSQVNSQALPISGIRQRVVAGSVDTISNANSLAIALNGARAELVWQAKSDWTPAELAANAAAIYSLEEAPLVPRMNFDFYGQDAVTSSNWKNRAPYAASSTPTRAQIMSALNNGVTPIALSSVGSTYLVKRITTRSLNGAVPDYRIRDSHKVTICDRYVDDLILKSSSTMRGKTIADDPRKNESEVPDAVTPRILKALINRLTRDYGDNGMLQRVGEIIAATQTNRETSPSTRLSALIPLQPIDILDQIAFKVDQIA